MAAGTGNLILKRGAQSGTDTVPIPDQSVLPKAMPAVQLNGSSPLNPDNTEIALVNTQNRLFIGSDLYYCNGELIGGGETFPGMGGTTVTDTLPCSAAVAGGFTQPRRPLWMGAEIRALYPVYEGNDTLPTILKADWSKPSDVVLVTQMAISNHIGFLTGVNKPSSSSIALLGSDGATKGSQVFQSPIGIDNYLELNSYSVGEVTYPATIKSANSFASIFDTNVTDISIGGASELIEIGDQTTDGTTSTVIYGDLTVTGDQVNLTNATQINAPNGNLILNGIKGIVADSSGNIYITGNLIVSGYLQTDVGLQGGPDAEKEYVGEGMVMDGGTF